MIGHSGAKMSHCVLPAYILTLRGRRRRAASATLAASPAPAAATSATLAALV
jgi:hypothetical protein